MPANRVRLAPLLGLNGSRAADESILPQDYRGIPMRGGYNVESVDGEWWCRRGYTFNDKSRAIFGSVPWFWFIHVDTDTYVIANSWYALEFYPSSNEVSQIYNDTITESVTYTLGAATCVSSTTRTRGELMLVDPSGGKTSEVYRVFGVSGSTVTLDRNYEGASGAKSTEFLPSFDNKDPTTDTDHYGEDATAYHWAQWALIDQKVTQSSPVTLTAGGRYLVINTWRDAPIAFRVDSVGDILKLWARDTSLSSPTVLSFDRGAGCVAHNNRLFLANRNTIYWSQQGDISMWHSGSVTGGTAALNQVTSNEGDGNDDLVGLSSLGNRIVGHRTRSQMFGTATGDGAAPYAFTFVNSGIGMLSVSSLVTANQRDYFMSNAGPVAFDGQSVTSLAPEMKRPLESMGMWQQDCLAFHDIGESKIYWTGASIPAGGNYRHQDASVPATNATEDVGNTGETYRNTRSVLCYDYQQEQFWFEDHIAIHGSGFESGTGDGYAFYVSRYDGTIMQWADGKYSGTKDRRNLGTEPEIETDTTYVVDCLVDSPWMDFGALERKTLDKIIVGWRPLALTTGGFRQYTDLWDSELDTLHLFTVDVFTDNDISTIRATGDADIVVSTMLAKTPDEMQQMPVVEEEVRSLGNVAGQSFKFRFKNKLSPAAILAGQKQGAFRIAYIEVYYFQEESTEPLAPGNPR